MKSFDESWELSMANARQMRKNANMTNEEQYESGPTNKYDVTAIIVHNETNQRFEIRKSYNVADHRKR